MQRLLLTLLAGLVSTAALAQESFNFDSNDTNDDGLLTETEWAEVDDVSLAFDDVDANRDGYIEQAEVDASLSGTAAETVDSSGIPVDDTSEDPLWRDRAGDAGAVSGGDPAAEPEYTSTSNDAMFRDRAGDSSGETGLDSGSSEYTSADNDPTLRDPVDDSSSTASASTSGSDEPEYTNAGIRGQEASQGQDVEQLDANDDGRVSRSEAQEDDEVVTHFVIWDTNQDGYLDETEVSEGRQQASDQNSGQDSGQDSGQASGEQDSGQASGQQTSGAQGSAGSELPSELVAFDSKDINGDGRLSRDETATDPQTSADFDMMDSNRDGYLDANEVTYDPETRTSAGASTSGAVSTFADHDSDGDGRLSQSEAANDTYINANFDGWDSNQDGYLDEEEIDAGWLENDAEGVSDEQEW